MANFWELITDASSLPISGSNTLWDHLNNLVGTGGGIIPVLSGIKVIDDLPKIVTAVVDAPVVVKVLLPEE